MGPLTVPGKLDSLTQIGEYVMKIAEEANLDKRAAYRLRLAVDEITTNIIMHGYEEAGIDGDVFLDASINDGILRIVVEDTGHEYDPTTHGTPESIDQPLEERPIGGLGIYLTNLSVDEFQYHRVGERNQNVFIVKLPVEES